MPDRFDAGDEDGSYEDQSHGPDFSVEQRYDALIAREQIRDVGRGSRIDAEQFSGDMGHLPECPVEGHVQAMIVPRREINRRESAVGEPLCMFLISAEQFDDAEIFSLGLDDASLGNRSDPADRAVGRTDDGIGIGGDRAGFRLERAGEELVEAAVSRRVRLESLRHIDAVQSDERADHRVFKGGIPAPGDGTHQPRQHVLGQYILAERKKLFRGRHTWIVVFSGKGSVTPVGQNLLSSGDGRSFRN